MPKESKTLEPIEVQISAPTQDEAVAKANELAKKEGYNHATVLNILEIKYKVRLYN